MNERLRKSYVQNVYQTYNPRDLFTIRQWSTAFRSENYLGIISGSAWKKVGIIWGLGSFRGQFGDQFGVGIISRVVQDSPKLTLKFFLCLEKVTYTFNITPLFFNETYINVMKGAFSRKGD